GLSGLAAVGTLRHPARSEPARHGAGKSRHAHERGGEKGGRAATETDRADDPVLPAGAVRRHPRPDRHQDLNDAVIARNRSRLARASRPLEMVTGPLTARATLLRLDETLQ